MRASKEMPTFDALFEPLIAALRALVAQAALRKFMPRLLRSQASLKTLHDSSKQAEPKKAYTLG